MPKPFGVSKPLLSVIASDNGSCPGRNRLKNLLSLSHIASLLQRFDYSAQVTKPFIITE
jgi:hypothetical protein